MQRYLIEPTGEFVEWGIADPYPSWYKRSDYRLIDKIYDPTLDVEYEISTIYLELDHNDANRIKKVEDPILFETMIFCKTPGKDVLNLHDFQFRYHSWEGAQYGHAKFTNMVFQKIDEAIGKL